MTTLFIMINLILNMIALLSIIILFLRQGKLLKLEDNQKKTVKEMEELLSSFVLEMKEDNEQLIKRIEYLKNENHRPNQGDQEQPMSIKIPIEKTIEKDEWEIGNDLTNRLEKTVGNYAVKAYQQSKQEKVDPKAHMKESGYLQESKNINPVQQESLADQIWILKTEGYSPEEIAQKMKKGKTEIDLLLKFQENHQE